LAALPPSLLCLNAATSFVASTVTALLPAPPAPLPAPPLLPAAAFGPLPLTDPHPSAPHESLSEDEDAAADDDADVDADAAGDDNDDELLACGEWAAALPASPLVAIIYFAVLMDLAAAPSRKSNR